MNSLNKIIYNLRNISAGGLDSDDRISKLSDRNLAYIVGYVRAFLVKRDLDKDKFVNPDLVQDLGCVPVAPVDKAECCELEVDCLILRTVSPLPKTIALNHSDSITFVGSVDGDEVFQITSQSQARWSKHNKYTASLRRAYKKKGHLYITNDLLIEHINVQGIFEDPLEAEKYVTCNNEPCFSFDSNYPIDAAMIKPLMSIILSDELGIVAKAIADNHNNAKDDTKR